MRIHLFLPELSLLAAAALLLPLSARPQTSHLSDGLYAQIATSKGTIVCQLEYKRTPLTVASFVGLAEGTLGPAPGKPFFEGLTFHRVVPNFVIQGGDPTATGEGGPGYTFPDEFVAGMGHDSAGILSMANEGPDTNGSQFFITLAPTERLNYLHSVFGRTVQGADVLANIAQGDRMHVRILRVGAAARSFRADEAAFTALKSLAKPYRFEKEPGPKSHFDDPDKLLPTDAPRAQNFNFKLANVERATGQRIYARLFAHFTPEAPGQDPDAFTRRLSRSLGIEDDGILAVYFADRKTWSFCIGRSKVKTFIGDRADGPKTPINVGLARALDAFRVATTLREAQYATQSNKVLANFLQIPGARIKISTDALIDGILAKMSL